jgi:predicted nucleotidyltransferase
MSIPNMGRNVERPSIGLADALFPRVQQRVLALLFAHPERRFQSAELIRLAESGTGAVHRQLSRLAEAGWVTVHRIGNQKHYQANRAFPAFAELHGLIVKTVGVVEPLREALVAGAKDIRGAFVYGSVARGSDKAGSDIDLMVISDRVGYQDLFEAVQVTKGVLARPINPNVMSLSEWRSKRAKKDSFAARIAAQPRLFVIGSDDDIG